MGHKRKIQTRRTGGRGVDLAADGFRTALMRDCVLKIAVKPSRDVSSSSRIFSTTDMLAAEALAAGVDAKYGRVSVVL